MFSALKLPQYTLKQTPPHTHTHGWNREEDTEREHTNSQRVVESGFFFRGYQLGDRKSLKRGSLEGLEGGKR